MAAKKKNKGAVKKKKGAQKGGKGRIFTVVGLLMAVVFLPTTFVLAIGMMPTIVAIFTDRSKRKSKAVTVGAMNLAGSVPFLLDLWTQGHNFDQAFLIVSDAKAIIVMYAAAAVGYLIDWAMTGIIASVLLQRGKARSRAIQKRQKELVKRWGKEVTGDVPVDQYGFAIEKKES